MNIFVDLTGNIVGNWTIVSRADNIGRRASYLCRCVCGTERVVLAQSLKSGVSLGCGCNRPRTRYGENLTGRLFTYLTVIEESSQRNSSGGILWKCQCKCGKVVCASSGSLRYGGTKSCGCWKKEHNSKALHERRFKHGLSKTKEYAAAIQKARSDRKENLDSQWTFEMESLIRSVYRSCVVCGSEKRLCIDHVKPLSKGYGLVPGNAVVLCTHCNSSKKDKDLEELVEDVREKIKLSAIEFKRIWEGSF